MHIARPIWRVLRVLEHLLVGGLISLYVSALERFSARPSWWPAVVCWWHGRLCRALGIRIEVSGQVFERCLIVSNHVSWLDIPVLGAQAELGFLSKAEVRGWPLVGWMATVAGTLFIERGGNQVACVAQQIGAGIAQGRILVIFPEGTTTDGREVARFHPRLFAAVQQPGVRIQSVAVRYHNGNDPAPDLSIAYIGDDSLIGNLWRVLRHPDLVVQVRFLEPFEPDRDEDRRALAMRARLGIIQTLGSPTAPSRAVARQSRWAPTKAVSDAASDDGEAYSSIVPGENGVTVSFEAGDRRRRHATLGTNAE